MYADIHSMVFKRRFAVNYYKNLKLQLGGMSFTTDFVNSTRGDMYPILEKSGTVRESLEKGCYCVEAEEGAGIRRLIGQYVPYSTSELMLETLRGEAGFCYGLPDQTISLFARNTDDGLVFGIREGAEERLYHSTLRMTAGLSILVTTRKGAFDFYCRRDREITYVTSFEADSFRKVMAEQIFRNTTVALELRGEVCLSEVSVYMDCGTTQADIRPVKYEDGQVMMENGKVYLTISCRQAVGCYQGIVSWVPGTCEFALTGVLFFDAGDGIWENDVASSIRFDRRTGKWYLWVCSFSHGHILGYSSMPADVRFGVNVVDLTLMKKMEEGDPDTAFLGKEGDEDPDFYYNREQDCWYMTVCRLVREGDQSNYRYFLFRSKEPFQQYEYVDCGRAGCETGGSMVEIGGRMHFVCGSDFDKRAVYHIYDMPDFSHYDLLKCDYDDGGFRGWGTIIPCPVGSRIRYYWLTFDRYRASELGNWSYGNLYGYEADIAEWI